MARYGMLYVKANPVEGYILNQVIAVVPKGHVFGSMEDGSTPLEKLEQYHSTGI